MQYILFDLDGTLIDHFSTIHRSVVYAQKQLGLPESDYATVRATVGGSAAVTLEKLCGKEDLEAAILHFRDHFNEHIFEDVFALPGAMWILKSLKERGARIGVFTNKFVDHTRAVLEHLGLDHWLDTIVGTGDSDCPYRKPDPIFTAYALEKMDCASEEAIIIGDSPYDAAAAEGGCVPCYLVATGSHDIDSLSECIDRERIYSDLYDLGQKLFGLDRPLVDSI